jgi:dihydroorotate dehydrogenase electron transfer subunit
VRGDDDIPLADDDPILQRTEVVAESGGRWRAGLVTEPTREHLDRMASDGRQEDHALYACGPWGMVGALQRSVGRDEVGLAQVSLEQHMGCAVGVCQGCAVVAEGGPTPYRLVCHDGPVFDLFGVEVPHAR